MKYFIFILNDKEYKAEVGSNAVIEQITELLPLELEFVANGSIEYKAQLPEIIDTESTDGVTKARRDQIGFIPEGNSICIFINDCDIEPEKLIYLGSFEDDMAGELIKSASRVRMLIKEGEEA